MSNPQSPQRLPASLTPFDVAFAALLRDVKPLVARASAERQRGVFVEMPDLKAWPPHDIAARDGWALRASDLVGASSYTPLPLPESPIWAEAGDRIPDGRDCVLDEDAVDFSGPIAQVLSEAIPGQGIRRKGGAASDVHRIVDVWRPGDLSAHRPRLRIVNLTGGDITSRLTVNVLRDAGAEVDFVETTARDASSIGQQLDAGNCDLLIVVGGSGVGRTDASVIALAKRGDVIAHGLALQPGRTAAIGRMKGTPVIVVPGAPDQALAVWWAIVLPVLDRLTARQRGTLTLPLARKAASGVGIAEVALLSREQGTWMPLAVGDLPFETVARADAWLMVPGGSEGYAAGTPASAYLLRE